MEVFSKNGSFTESQNGSRWGHNDTSSLIPVLKQHIAQDFVQILLEYLQ